MCVRPISTNHIDFTYFKCQIIWFTLTPTDGTWQDKHSHSLNRCEICVHSQTPGGTCPSAPCLVTPLEWNVPDEWIESGREFQIAGAAAQKERQAKIRLLPETCCSICLRLKIMFILATISIDKRVPMSRSK